MKGFLQEFFQFPFKRGNRSLRVDPFNASTRRLGNPGTHSIGYLQTVRTAENTDLIRLMQPVPRLRRSVFSSSF